MLPLTVVNESPFSEFWPRDEESPYISIRLQLNTVKATTAIKAEVASGPPVPASRRMLPIPTLKDKSEITPRMIMQIIGVSFVEIMYKHIYREPFAIFKEDIVTSQVWLV